MNISFNKRFLFFLFICFLIYLQGIFKLPVMDRDEARFATASKTMLIEKDFIDIKMVEEKRYKKPIGIYWTQSLMNSIFGSYPYDKISIYRLPSILGVFISFFLIFVIIGFLFSNFGIILPKTFLGDAGSTTLGFVISCYLIYFTFVV